MLIKINSVAIIGLSGQQVEVEVDVNQGFPDFFIVGLPDAAVKESQVRIRSAIKNSGLDFPYNKRIVINLAPADIKKEGVFYDLPMAVGLMLNTLEQQLDLSDSLFVGEVSLDGTLRHTNGILPVAIFAREKGIKNLYLPAVNADEASLIGDLNIYPVNNLIELLNHLLGLAPIKVYQNKVSFIPELDLNLDMAQIKGQEHVKRAMEIAAAGAHNVIMSGPPGSGKTLIAKTLPTILPAMTEEEILEVTKIYSIAGLLSQDRPLINIRPFRCPHHTSSGVALVGGGRFPKPGEISLAHRGVLFLDEFAEFPRKVLENLRQPLEDGIVSVSRAAGSLIFPAKFTLIAAQNPCPCGYLNDSSRQCTCSPATILKYQLRVSGPILDRIDMQIEVPHLSFEKLSSEKDGESSADIRKRVEAARQKQKARFSGLKIITNSEMGQKELKAFCVLDSASLTLMKNAMEQMHLSARSYHRILKLARTIADLDNSENILLNHLAEALQYRTKS